MSKIVQKGLSFSTLLRTAKANGCITVSDVVAFEAINSLPLMENAYHENANSLSDFLKFLGIISIEEDKFYIRTVLVDVLLSGELFNMITKAEYDKSIKDALAKITPEECELLSNYWHGAD